MSASPSPDALAAIDALLQPFNRADAPGLLVGIRQQGRWLLRRGLGLASLEQGVANTPRTRMRIASTSKHFTALAILLLAEDGLLSLDDPVQRHLPELPQLHPDGPTLRQLLNHTSGWRGHDEMWVLAQGLAPEPPGTSLAAMARQGALNSDPGTRFIYSNGAYHLLALIVGRASGLGYAGFLRQRMFEPLGMLDSDSLPNDLDVRPGMAMLYQPTGPQGQWRRGLYPCECEGGGSLISTLDDMMAWLANLRGVAPDAVRGEERPMPRRVGTDATWARMLAPTTLASGEVLQYGFGLARHAYRGVEVIHHNGAMMGCGSQMITVPAHGLDIVILANGAPVAPAALALKFIDALLEPALAPPPPPRAALADHAGLAGQRYHSPETGNVVAFVPAGDRLAMSWLGFTPVPLRERRDENGLRRGLGLDFLDLSTNRLDIDLDGVDTRHPPEALTLHEAGSAQRLQRLPETPPGAAELAPALSGRYACPDLDASARIELRGDELLFTVQGRHGQMPTKLKPLSDSVFTVVPADPLLAAMGASSLLNVERVQGRITGLRFDSVRTRRLRFTREESAA